MSKSLLTAAAATAALSLTTLALTGCSAEAPSTEPATQQGDDATPSQQVSFAVSGMT